MANGKFLRAIAAFMLIASVGLMIGCNTTHEATTQATVQSQQTNQNLASSVQPRVETDDGNLYFYTDPYGAEIITQTAELPRVQSYLAQYTAMQYSLQPAYSFVMEGYVHDDETNDSTFVQHVTLAMVWSPDTTRQAMYLTYSETSKGQVVAPYKLSFIEPEPLGGFRKIAEGLWRLNYPADVYLNWIGRNRTIDRSEPLTLDTFLDCVEEETMFGCGVAIVACAVTLAFEPACAAAGCGAALIGATLHCAYVELCG
jgi:hypothetical protein